MEPTSSKPYRHHYNVIEPWHLRKDLQTLLSVMLDISSELNIDKLLHKIIRHATELCDGDSGTIALVDESGAVTQRYPYQAPQAVVEAEIHRGKGALFESLAKRKTVIVNDYASYPQRIESFVQAGVKAVLVTPIARKDKVVGVMEVFNQKTGRRFTRYHAGLLEAVAAQAAVAIENAKLYESQRQSQQEIAGALRTENILLEAATVIGSTLDLKQVLSRLSDLVAELTGLKRNIIYLYDPKTRSNEVAAAHNVDVAIGSRYTKEEMGPELFEIYRTGEEIILDRDDPRLSPATKQFMDSFNAKRGLFVPLIVGEHITGSIGMDNPGAPHEFTEREIELAKGLARQAAIAIENARLFEQLKSSSQELERSSKDLKALIEVALNITSGLKLDELMYKIAKNATELTGADAGAVGLYDVNRGIVTYPFIYNLPEVLAKVDVPITSSMSGVVIGQREPLLIEDYQQFSQRMPVFAEAGLRALAMVPLLFRGTIIGTLWVSSRDPYKKFEQRDLTVLESIGRQAAIALENARLFENVKASEEETRRIAKELSILNSISYVLSQTLELNTILSTAIDNVMDTLGADGAAIFLLDVARNVLTLAVERGLSQHFIENSREITVGERLPGVIAETGKPLIIENLADYPEFEATVEYEAFKSLVGAPIKSKGRVIGAFPLGSRQVGKFTQRDAVLLESIGNEIGVAIENSRLYEAQRTISESLQRSMLPAHLPTIPNIELGVRYSSATEEALVGGDFYDIYNLDGKYALIIGDVSGKGIEAASYTSMMKYSLRSYLYQSPSPSYALTKVNEFVMRQEELAVFITLFCSVYDTKTGSLIFSNAGHPYPCLLNQLNKTCAVLTSDDPAIGIVDNHTYNENIVTVNPGNLFVAYTDGVLEARSDKQFFGEERLIGVLLNSLNLPAQDIADVIIKSAFEFSHGKLTDDIALLVARRTQ